MSSEKNILLGELDLSKVKGLLFDVDGTLSDTDDLMVSRLANIIHPLGFLLNNDRDVKPVARRLVMAVESPSNLLYNLADRLGLDNFVAKLLSSNARKKKLKQSQFLLIPNVGTMLDSLHPHFKLGVVSARDAVSTNAFLKYFGLIDFFNVIVTGQTCQRTKPFPDPVIFAAESMGLRSEECVMIGDTVVDIKAGKSAGAQTVGVLCGFGTFREIKRAMPDLILSTTRQLSDILLP